MDNSKKDQEIDPSDGFDQEIETELDQARRTLKEIKIMLEQSQVELNKLTQRNNAITIHLQKVQSQIDSVPRGEIRMAYDSALDAQQRIFVMRGQIEKLQSDQAFLKRYQNILERAQKVVAKGWKPTEDTKSTKSMDVLQMVINAQEEERQRLSRQMHDGPAQALSNFILQTEIAMRLFEVDPARAKEELANLKTAAMSTFQKVRNFIFELRPMMLDDLGLIPTVKRYLDTYKEHSGIDTSLEASGTEQRLESYQEVLIFRALQELLSNAAKYGQATQIKVQIAIDDNFVKIAVDDNGKGFDSNNLKTNAGLGLKLIRERVEMLNGKVELDSVVGRGTRVAILLPVLKKAFVS